MSLEKDIHTALTQPLKTLDPIVAYTNATYTPVSGQEYYEETILPAEGASAGIGVHAQNRKQGVFQINCHAPKGQGRKAEDMIDVLGTLYKRGTDVSFNGVLVRINKAGRGSEGSSKDWFTIVFNVQYQSDVDN